ncbi:hypothetical protein LTR28_008107 [Elasticomyces elasticus]|nr:hypothetical protein LTR28_008107 [Elasticomyces elasticus]
MLGASYFARTNRLSAEHYQELVDRGWRRSGSLLEKAKQKTSFDLLQAVHESEVDQLKPIEPAHRFSVTLEADSFSDEKFALYAKYQVHVHHDAPSEISPTSFKSFLCSSPLHGTTQPASPTTPSFPTPPPKPLGSYHQCYRLNGRLIALSVLDLLPHAVSGVYFIYDPAYERHSFGKLSALREAALALERGYAFYYMGYYIHDCAKMRYKAEYRPQFVLDPEGGGWEPLEGEVRALMGRRKYVSLAGERRRRGGGDARAGVEGEDGDAVMFPAPLEAVDSGLSLLELGMPGVMSLEEIALQLDLDEVRLLLRGAVHRMKDLVSWDGGSVVDSSSLKGLVAEFVACIGPKLAREVLVSFS